MAEWLAVIAVMALFGAVVRGFQRGAQSAGHLYREAKTRLTKDAVAAGHGRFARSAGRNAGLAAAATVGGVRVIGAAIWRGMGEGWRHGWNRGQTRRANTVDHDTTIPDPDPIVSRGTTVPGEPTTGPRAHPEPDLGWMGYASDRGAATTAVGRCSWDVGGRPCSFPLSPAKNAKFCVSHEQRYRHEFGCQLPFAGDICGDYPATDTTEGLRCAAHRDGPPIPDNTGCCYTLGDPSNPEQSRSCGAPTEKGKEYCHPHWQLTCGCQWHHDYAGPQCPNERTLFGRYCPQHNASRECPASPTGRHDRQRRETTLGTRVGCIYCGDGFRARLINRQGQPLCPVLVRGGMCGRPIHVDAANQADCGNHKKEGTTTPMTTSTAAVEVRTIRQLCDALKDIANTARAELEEARAEQGRAATDMEDATAAKKRADDESRRIEGAQAHLGAMNLDPESLGEIAAVHVACAEEVTSSAARVTAAEMRLAAAKKRVTGAETRAAAADKAATGIWGRHGRSQEAAEESSVKVADGGAYNPV